MGAHVLCKLVVALGSYHLKAGNTIGAECNFEKSRHKVVELFALLYIAKRGAIGTRCVAILHVAGSNFTPLGLFVLGTAGAFSFFVGSAFCAKQAAEGYQFFIVCGLHGSKAILGLK